MNPGDTPLADRDAAAAQLAALQADREALAERAMQPWWYDVVLGVLTATFLASFSLEAAWAPPVAAALYALGSWWLVRVYRRRTGTWVNGDRPGATRQAWRTWVVFSAVVLAPAAVLEWAFDVRGALAVAGVVLGVGVAVISRWWTRIYVAELRGER